MFNLAKGAIAGTLDTAADVADDASAIGAAVVDSTVETAVDLAMPAADMVKGFIKIPAIYARHIAKALRGEE